jgi:hypothetical protein
LFIISNYVHYKLSTLIAKKQKKKNIDFEESDRATLCRHSKKECDSSSKYAKNEEITKTPSRIHTEFGGLCPNKTGSLRREAGQFFLLYKIYLNRRVRREEFEETPFDEIATCDSIRREERRRDSKNSSNRSLFDNNQRRTEEFEELI